MKGISYKLVITTFIMTIILTEHPPKQSFANDGFSRGFKVILASPHFLILADRQSSNSRNIKDIVDTSDVISCKDYRDKGDSIKVRIKNNLTALKEQQSEIKLQTEQIRLLISNK
jgi:hypothetical protein